MGSGLLRHPTEKRHNLGGGGGATPWLQADEVAVSTAIEEEGADAVAGRVITAPSTGSATEVAPAGGNNNCILDITSCVFYIYFFLPAGE